MKSFIVLVAFTAMSMALHRFPISLGMNGNQGARRGFWSMYGKSGGNQWSVDSNRGVDPWNADSTRGGVSIKGVDGNEWVCHRIFNSNVGPWGVDGNVGPWGVDGTKGGASQWSMDGTGDKGQWSVGSTKGSVKTDRDRHIGNFGICNCELTDLICASNDQTYPGECYMNYCSGEPVGSLHKMHDGPCPGSDWPPKRQ